MTPRGVHVAFGAWVVDAEPSGARTRLLGLLTALGQRITAPDRITVLHGPDFGAHPDFGAQFEWRCVPIPPTPAFQRARAERKVLPTVLRELGTDLVELATLPVPAGLPCPASLTIHDLRDLDGWPRRRLPKWCVRAVLRRSILRAHRIVVPSEFTASRLRAHGLDARPITVVPGGVASQEAKPASPRARCVVHVGHLEPRKNLGVLVDALAQLPDDVSLELIGADHGAGARLRDRARRRGVAARVHLRAACTDSEVAAAYRRAGVVAVPSLYEGFGLPVAEALAHGAPLVIADSPALLEVAGEAAERVPGTDSAEWAAALRRALERPEHGASGRIARAASLSWESAADALAADWPEIACFAPPRDP